MIKAHAGAGPESCFAGQHIMGLGLLFHAIGRLNGCRVSDSDTARWTSPDMVLHIERLLRSYAYWTGRHLISGPLDPREAARVIANAPFVVTSHGTERDPILNYGNKAALSLWEMDWEDFIRTPSRLTAEAPVRAERERLLKTVSDKGYIDDYSGVRISKTGRRFRIERAIVWNVMAEDGVLYGQAATFDLWKFL